MKKYIAMVLTLIMITATAYTTVYAEKTVSVDPNITQSGIQAIRDSLDLVWSDDFGKEGDAKKPLKTTNDQSGEAIDKDAQWLHETSAMHRNGQQQVYADNDGENSWTEDGKQYIDAAGNIFDPTTASTVDFITFFQVNLINPKVLVGAFLGAMAAFLFCGLTMGAVGRAAGSMVQEVRRQFREIRGILEGEATPDYGRCVEISTRSAQREMILPSLLAIIIPIVVGLVLGVAGVLGLLTGGLAAGFTLAVFMSNSGGAWDNAKKMVEEGHFGGKGSENHKSTIVGDTVGDPFKDTSGPSLNILIKLMSMVSIVMAGLTIAFL